MKNNIDRDNIESIENFIQLFIFKLQQENKINSVENWCWLNIPHFQ